MMKLLANVVIRVNSCIQNIMIHEKRRIGAGN